MAGTGVEPARPKTLAPRASAAAITPPGRLNSLQTGKGIGISYQLSVISFQLKRVGVYLTPLGTDN